MRARLGRHLARLPAFARCRRAELRRIAQWGELIEVDPGEVLLREDHGDFWFFVLVTGEVRFSRRGSYVGTAGPGSHFGERAIVGLRPQQATATTAEPSVLFVLGPRYVLSLLGDSARFRNVLLPDVGATPYPDFAKRMRDEGRAEWRRLAPPPAPRRVTHPEWLVTRLGENPADGRTSDRWPGRPASLREAAALLTGMPSFDTVEPPVSALPARTSRWLLASVVSLLAGVVAATLLLYHPPRAVVTAGRPIDVVGDITIDGHTSLRSHGRYLLLWVRVSRPSLASLVLDVVRGETTVAIHAGSTTAAEQTAAQQSGRRQYLDSQHAAVMSAAAAVGIDPRRLSVTIRDRGLVGPSGGLIYALAIVDMLSGRDLAAGRVIAASGALENNGKVDPVGWVSVKAQGAASARAAVLLVPAGEQGAAYGSVPTVYGVANLLQALQALRGKGPTG
jgi:PDZ domain-containing protein